MRLSRWAHQFTKTEQVNSGPLSTLILIGITCSRMALSSIRTTRWLGELKFVPITRHYHFLESTSLSILLARVRSVYMLLSFRLSYSISLRRWICSTHAWISFLPVVKGGFGNLKVAAYDLGFFASFVILKCMCDVASSERVVFIGWLKLRFFPF